MNNGMATKAQRHQHWSVVGGFSEYLSLLLGLRYILLVAILFLADAKLPQDEFAKFANDDEEEGGQNADFPLLAGERYGIKDILQDTKFGDKD